MQQKPRVILLSPIIHAHDVYHSVSQVAKLEVVTSRNRLEFFTDAKSKYNDVVALYSTATSWAVGNPALKFS